jgi:hypothetical protein
MALNISRAYKTKLCKLARIPEEKFDFYYRKAFQRLNCDPIKDIGLIAKTMRYMAKKYEYVDPKTETIVRPPVSYRGGYRIRRFSVVEIDDIIKRYKNKELLRDIAEAHNCSMSSISELAKRSGLALRQRGAHKLFSESKV